MQLLAVGQAMQQPGRTGVKEVGPVSAGNKLWKTRSKGQGSCVINKIKEFPQNRLALPCGPAEVLQVCAVGGRGL